MWAKVSISGYHMTPQEFFSGKFSRLCEVILREEKKETDKSWVLSNCLQSHLSSQVHYGVNMLSEKSPKHCQYQFCGVVQSLSLVWLFVTPCAARSLGFPSLQIAQFSQSHDLWVSDALQPSQALSFPSPPALNLSQHQFLSSDFALGLRWPICWLFMFSISPSTNRQSWFPSCFTSLNSRLATENLHIFSSPTVAKHRHFGVQFCGPALSSIRYTWKSTLTVWIYFSNLFPF